MKKKILSLLLALVLCLSLAACGGESAAPKNNGETAPDDTKTETPAPTPEEESVEVPGSYLPVGPFPVDIIALNENGSYDCGEDKGTYSADDDGERITIKPKEGSSRYLTACGEYYHTDTKMTEDTEYGLTPAFDANGRSNQGFTINLDGTDLTLELSDDGSFTFSYSKESEAYYRLFDVVTFDGSYTLDDTVLNLNSGSGTFRLLFADDALYPIVYAKKTDENSADVEAVYAAAKAIKEDAERNTWWTVADEETAAEITAALMGGAWEYNSYSEYKLTFRETDVGINMGFMGSSVRSTTGTYIILNKAILLEYKTLSGGYNVIHTMAVPYTYEDGSLALYEMLDVLNTEGIDDPAADLTQIAGYQFERVE